MKQNYKRNAKRLELIGFYEMKQDVWWNYDHAVASAVPAACS
jgi:hypothetical protein